MKVKATVLLILISFSIQAQKLHLMDEATIQSFDTELSGESAKRNLEYLSRLHRMRGSDDYNEATSFIMEQIKAYGLEEIELIQIPTDGKTFYGTQKSRPAWNVDFAELWELEEKNGQWVRKDRLANWEAIPLTLAQDSESGEARTTLVDIGSGTNIANYEGKDIRGKLVLTSSQPSAVAKLAVKERGAAGIVSYAPNQVTAWYKEDENLIRWGHLATFTDITTFAFMVSLKQARSFQQRLANGEVIMLDAKVEARKEDGTYDILTGVIKGSDPSLSVQEIMFTCHLDHPRPGANDNASGAVAILEVARALTKMINEGQIERPKRSIRFIWSPEIEGTTSLLNYRPEFARNTVANIHMDMVGGNANTKAIFHVSRSPKSLPNIVNSIGEDFGNYVNKVSYQYASGANPNYPIVAKEGDKEELRAVLGNFHMGSDFEVFSEGSFKIPSIYLHDWPDRYIHTNYDVPGNIDPTKLKRAAFIGGGSAYVLANLSADNSVASLDLLKAASMKRTIAELDKIAMVSSQVDKDNMLFHHWQYESEMFEAASNFGVGNSSTEKEAKQFIKDMKKVWDEGNAEAGKLTKVYVRNNEIKGMMPGFGYNYFTDHYGPEKAGKLALFNYQGRWGGAGVYAYEILNLVDGKRTVTQIRNAVSAEFGTIPEAYVAGYLAALQSINVLK
jgi:aminopeptidase YwaD